MKKITLLCAIGLCLVATLFTGCISSQSRTLASNEISSQAIVLGEVVVESKTFSYSNLLEAAKKKYPDAQDVVHIQTDELSNKKFRMFGIAVKY